MNSLHFIPFKVTGKQAEQAYYNFHHSSWFRSTTKQCGVVNVKQAYLPFYSFKVTVDSYITVTLTGPDESKRHILRHTWDGMDGDNPMQIYASSHFNRALVNDIKKDLFHVMKDLSKSQLESNVEALAFSIDPSTALSRFISPFIESREHKRCQKFLQSKYTFSRYQSHSQVQIWKSFHVTPCYIPCFIFESQMPNDDQVFHTFVEGVTGKVSGFKHFNANIISLAAATLTSSFGLLFPPVFGLKAFLGWFTTFTAAPFLVSSIVARSTAFFRQTIMEHNERLIYGIDSAQIQKYDPAADPVWWDFERVISRFHHWQEEEAHAYESQKWAEYHQYIHELGGSHTNNSTSGKQIASHPDPGGYYRILGLSGREAISNIDDIQKAFKSLAAEYHPDKQIDTDLKQRNSKIFQDLSVAYSILKDGKFFLDPPHVTLENLRRKYDLFGRV